jgi:prepilin-type N-terminal cleavage/methylation domain-containing protein
MKKRVYGFTIVELLIVIVVIAILAAISIAAYTNIQSRARAAGVQSDLTNAMKQLKLYRVTQNYPTSTDELKAVGITVSKDMYETNLSAGNFYYCLNSATDEIALGARTVGDKDQFIITSSSGLKQVTSAVTVAYTCQSIGLASATAPNAFGTYAYYSTGGGGWNNWVK